MIPGSGDSGTGGSGGSGNGGTGGSGGSGGGHGSGPVNDTPAGDLGGSGLAGVVSFLPVLVAAGGGAAMLMAFLLFGKRRKSAREVADDGALAASAATGLGYAPVPRVTPVAPRGLPAPAAVPVPVTPAAAAAATAAVQANAIDVSADPGLDAHLPRWRRPSLMEARKNDPTRQAMAAGAHLTFNAVAGDALSGLERRRIRYRLVSLLDMPDEIRGVEIGSLDEGDEVVLMEKRGTYWRVLCPDGREGWLHKMTLGDTVIEASTAADSWTAAEADGPDPGGFEDILRRYSESRSQFGGA